MQISIFIILWILVVLRFVICLKINHKKETIFRGLSPLTKVIQILILSPLFTKKLQFIFNSNNQGFISLFKVPSAILFGWVLLTTFFLEILVIILTNNDNLKFNKTYPNKIAGNPLKSKMNP